MINFNSTATFEEKDYMERCVKTTYAIMSFFEIEDIVSLRNKFVNMQATYLSTIDSISQLIHLSVDALSVVQTEHTMNLFTEKRVVLFVWKNVIIELFFSRIIVFYY